MQVTEMPPAESGILLHACSGVWLDVALNIESPSKFQKLYKRLKATGKQEFALAWALSSLVLICHDAKTRTIVLPAFEGVIGLFAVVLTGIAFVIEAGECTALKAGAGHVFCPEITSNTLRVDVERYTSVLLAYTSSCDEGSAAQQRIAHKFATRLVAERDVA